MRNNGVPRKGLQKTAVVVYGPRGRHTNTLFINDEQIKVDVRREAPTGIFSNGEPCFPTSVFGSVTARPSQHLTFPERQQVLGEVQDFENCLTQDEGPQRFFASHSIQLGSDTVGQRMSSPQ
jgi:hypothetical protein